MCVNSNDVLKDTSLMNELANELNKLTDTSLTNILKMIGEAYHFENGFIYQSDYKNNFNLMENYTTNRNKQLPKIVTIDFFNNILDVNKLIQNSDKKMETIYFHELDPKSIVPKNKLSYFAGKMFIMFFVLNEEKKLIAEVGFCSDENEQTYSNDDLQDLNTLITMLVYQVRNRIAVESTQLAIKTLESIMNNTGFDIYVNDFETHEVLYANESMAKPYGGVETTKNKTCHEWLYHGQKEECTYCPKHKIIDDEGNPTKIYSWDYQRPMDGAWFRVMSAAFDWTDGRVAHVVSSMDITENVKNQELIKEMAYLDALTKIPNRRQLEEDVNDYVTHNKDKNATMLFVDLNHFKSINDNFGHKFGDAILVAIAQYLNNESCVKYHAYRYAGDEFILFFDNEDYKLDEVIASIKQRFEKPWEITFDSNTQLLNCGASFGYATYPVDGKNYVELLDASDQKMYKEKNKQRD